MGIFALGITGVSFQQYIVTFEEYLNSAMHVAGDCYLNTAPLYSSAAVYEGCQDGTIDFSVVEPTNFVCLTVHMVWSKILPVQ